MKPIPSVYRRDGESRRHIGPAVTPGCEWVLAGEGVARRQYGGIAVLHTPGAGTSTLMPELDGWWFRRLVPLGALIPDGFVRAGGVSADGRLPGWIPTWMSAGGGILREALRNLPASDAPQYGTHELIGPQVRGNPERVRRHLLIAHRDADIVDAPRHFEELRRWLLAQPYRGVVWHRGDPAETMAKVRRRDLQP